MGEQTGLRLSCHTPGCQGGIVFGKPEPFGEITKSFPCPQCGHAWELFCDDDAAGDAYFWLDDPTPRPAPPGPQETV